MVGLSEMTISTSRAGPKSGTAHGVDIVDGVGFVAEMLGPARIHGSEAQRPRFPAALGS